MNFVRHRNKRRVLSPHEVRQVAVAALCHPETVTSFIAGRPVRPLSEQRIVAALKQLGLDEHAREQSAA